MKTLSRTLLITALLAVPFASVQAHEGQSAHEAWIEAQKIDIKPTLKITETEIPADSVGATSGQGTHTHTPSSGMHSSEGHMPAAPVPGTQQGGEPVYTNPGVRPQQ